MAAGSIYESVKALAMKPPLELCLIGIPIATQTCVTTVRLSAKSGNAIYAGWAAQPKFIAAGMGLGGIVMGVGGWLTGKGINAAADFVVDAAVAEITTLTNSGATIPPGVTTTLLVAKKIYNYKDEITASTTILGTALGIVGGGVIASYAVLPEKEFSAAWERGWTREDNISAELKASIRRINKSRFGAWYLNKPGIEDMRAVMFHMDKIGQF